MSSCSKSFAMSSAGALKASVGGTLDLGSKASVDGVLDLELVSVGISSSGGLSLTTKLGVWDGRTKSALAALPPLVATGAATRLCLPHVFRHVYRQVQLCV